MSQSRGGSVPDTITHGHKVPRVPGTWLQRIANGVLPRLRPQHTGETQEPTGSNIVHRLESLKLGPQRSRRPTRPGEGACTDKTAEQALRSQVGQLPAGARPTRRGGFRTFRTGSGSRARARARVGGATLPEVPAASGRFSLCPSGARGAVRGLDTVGSLILSETAGAC